MSNKLPGMCARHVIITPTCRKNKGDVAVIEETIELIRSELKRCLPGWPVDGANIHVAMTVEPLPAKQEQPDE